MQDIYKNSLYGKTVEFVKKLYPTLPTSLIGSDTLSKLQLNLNEYNSLYSQPRVDNITSNFNELQRAINEYNKKTLGSYHNSIQDIVQNLDTSGLNQLAKEFASSSHLLWQNNPNSLLDFTSTFDDIRQIQEGIQPSLEAFNNLLKTSSGDVINQFAIIKAKAENLLPSDFHLYEEAYNNLPKGSVLQGRVEIVNLRLYVTGESVEYPLDSQPQIEGIQSLFEGLDILEILKFRDYLLCLPMLGHKHRVGEIIYKEMERLLLSSNSPNLNYFHDVPPNQSFYRCRKWEKPCQEEHYSTYEMFQPPFGKSSIGRFNPSGVNYSNSRPDYI